MTLEKLLSNLKNPELYAKSEAEFWIDPYISEQLLKAHLNQNFDGASRNIAFIEKSINWISKVAPASNFENVIDLGCGLGLYAERLAKQNYAVTALDFSENSIKYAKKAAKKHNLTIDYRVQNYLTWQEPEKYDLALLIYCDYGALSFSERQQLLKNIYDSLKSGGKLVLDVFSIAKLAQFQIGNNWEYHEKDGFWSAGKHGTMARNQIYADDITLEQTILLKDDNVTVFNIWHQYFTLEKIKSELEIANFKILNCFGDISGKEWTNNSETMSFVVQKA
ncbi:class I SAM-dependent methyltransferase [Listeria seeligeri]|uniref:class I SAM-dependent methyltransferase n=1 Tax=Listeria seeligeri TaxID=1640 RepID=UPI0022EBF09D|nr:methyltransferase domain-containing protein [Listeria seeligeri]